MIRIQFYFSRSLINQHEKSNETIIGKLVEKNMFKSIKNEFKEKKHDITYINCILTEDKTEQEKYKHILS